MVGNRGSVLPSNVQSNCTIGLPSFANDWDFRYISFLTKHVCLISVKDACYGGSESLLSESPGFKCALYQPEQ